MELSHQKCLDATEDLLGRRYFGRLRRNFVAARFGEPLDSRKLIRKLGLARKRRSIAVRALNLAILSAQQANMLPAEVVVR